MKRLVAAVLSTLVIAVANPSAVKAQSDSLDSSASKPVTMSNSVDGQLTPFDLAFFAYRDYLKDEGIPSGQLLVTEIEAGNVSPKDIVQAAIKAHRLSEQMLTDQGYLNSLESQLDLFVED